MKYLALALLFILLGGCFPHPGSLGKLPENSKLRSADFPIDLSRNGGNSLTALYLGCGGLYLNQNGTGILFDPFFSHQGIGTLAKSVLSKQGRKRTVKSDSLMVAFGLQAIEKKTGPFASQVEAIFTAHSHYDHLLDVPAVFSRLQKKPMVYVSESGYNICSNVIDRTKLEVLEKHMSTQETVRPPIVVLGADAKKINVYPILADHNPHLKNIKAFSGSTTRPLQYFKNPYDSTRANDWLEGVTFSFLVDCLGATGDIELRLFIQSSSCNPPAGTPPDSILQKKPVDVAFLGVASYEASLDYPGYLLKVLSPRKVVWIHWEDFFRGYSKKPKTVRGTNVREFFEKEVQHHDTYDFYTPWPRVKMDIHY